MKSGIYKITNLINNKFYIGSSNNINVRRNNHFYQLRKGIHSNKYLQNSFRKHHEQNFKFEILEYCTVEQLIQREIYYIETLKPQFNLKPLENTTVIPKRKFSEEYIEKLRQTMLDRWANMSTEKRLEFSNKFKKEKSHLWKGGKSYLTCPICKKEIKIDKPTKTCRDCIDFNGDKNPFYGKKHSDETKLLLSKKLKGKPGHNNVKVEINGIKYNSLSDAGNALGVSGDTISARTKRGVLGYKFI